MDKKAQNIISSYDFTLRYKDKYSVRKTITQITRILETAIRLGYEDFAKAYTICLVRAARISRD